MTMKLLTIMCSADLSGTVERALERAGVEGFVTVPDAVGVKFAATPPHFAPPRWPASLYIAPAPAEVASAVVASLEAYAGQCDSEPCLRIVVTAAEQAR